MQKKWTNDEQQISTEYFMKIEELNMHTETEI